MFPTASKYRYLYTLVALLGLLLGLVIWNLNPEPEEVIENPEVVEVEEDPNKVIGNSVEGRDIEVYVYGEGPTTLLFVGGIHGGYEWNSVLLTYHVIDYLENTELSWADNFTVHVIPNLNPDGVYKVVGHEGRFTIKDVPTEAYNNTTGIGRFNANGVDLNRNFACNWQPESTWRSKTVSAGEFAFSEPEAATLRDYVGAISPEAVVFWHSKANAVYASECNEGVLPKTIDIMNTYATAADYRAVESFDAYPISGDAEGWLASLGIPAITVELSTHETIESQRNIAGVKALFDYFSGE